MRNRHTIRLDGKAGSLTITRRVSDLEFTNIENGGYGSGSFTLQRPISRTEFLTYTDVLVFDGRTARQVAGGRILTPGRSASDQGEVANVAFLGEGPAAMGAVERPYFLIDQTMDHFVMASRTTTGMDYNTSPYPNSSTPEDASLLMDTKDGATILENAELVIVNRLAQRCGMLFGGIGYRHKEGQSTVNWRARARMYSNDLSGWDTVDDDAWDTTISSRAVRTVNGAFTNKAVAGFQWKRLNSDDVAVAGTWSAFRDWKARAQLYGTDGVLRTIGYTNEYVLAGEAFVDWCVRNCPTFDMEHANVTPGTYEFDQLSWPDGIDGMAFMDELLSMEQGLMWGVYEKQGNGLFRTELIERSTQVRYELSTRDGYDEAAPADDLFNVVYVLWTSPAGKPQMTRVPSTGVADVPDLDARGGVPQSKVLTMGDEVGSASQATQRGQEFLDAHATVPNGGTLTISGGRRIRDNYTGRLIAPWEIEPGYVGRIRGLSPRPDTLNPNGAPNGSTLVRIVSMNWSDSRSTAQLQLDAYPVDQYHMIADLITKRR